jgi:hypothetical protein
MVWVGRDEVKGSVQGLDLRPVARCRIAASVPSRGDLFGPACGTHFARVIIDVTSLRGCRHNFASHNVVLAVHRKYLEFTRPSLIADSFRVASMLVISL